MNTWSGSFEMNECLHVLDRTEWISDDRYSWETKRMVYTVYLHGTYYGSLHFLNKQKRDEIYLFYDWLILNCRAKKGKLILRYILRKNVDFYLYSYYSIYLLV